jgi:hypothetical protein
MLVGADRTGAVGEEKAGPIQTWKMSPAPNITPIHD